MTWPTTSARCSGTGVRTCGRPDADERSWRRQTRRAPTDGDLSAWLGWCTVLAAATRCARRGQTRRAGPGGGAARRRARSARHQAQEAAVHRWDAEGWPASPGPLAAGTGRRRGARVHRDHGRVRRRTPLAGRGDAAGRPTPGASWRRVAGGGRRAGGEAELAGHGLGPGADALPAPPRAGLQREGDPLLVAAFSRLGRHVVTELTFLGTGNFLAPPGRYWNSFVMDASVLVEPSPTALPAPAALRIRGRRHRGRRRLALPCRPLLRMAVLPPGGGRARRRPHAPRGGAARASRRTWRT